MTLGRSFFLFLAAAGMAAAGAGGFYAARRNADSDPPAESSPKRSEAAKTAEVVPGKADTVRIPKDAVAALGLRLGTCEMAPEKETLTMSGTLFIDSNRLAYVHCRFPGEVIEIGKVPNAPAGTSTATASTGST